MDTTAGHRQAFTLIELMIVVAIIAIFAMVAIPAFVKYVRRSKTTEATMNIRKLYDASVAYYGTERAVRASGGSMIPRQFPQSWGPYPTIIPAPAVVKCCRQPGGKCPPIRQTCIQFTKYGPGGCDNFFTQLFSPLNFSIDDPFYFHYGYMSTGTDRAARFTAGAYGDLDCDDAWSTYERAGSVDSLWNVTGSGLYVHDDIE